MKRILLTLCLLLLAAVAYADGFKVSDVLIEGNNRVETASILAVTSINPGDEVTLEDVDQALHRIFAMGRFKDVTAELNDVNGAKILIFVVQELPLVREIRLSGNDQVKEDKLRDLLKIRAPELYSEAKVKESIAEMLKSYAKDGYHAAKIDPQLEVNDRNEAVLTFKIDEGEKTLIDEIRFIGNKAIEADDLKDVMETRESWWLSWLTGRGAYQEEIMDVDLLRLKSLYQEKGYMDVKVGQPQLTLDKDKEHLKVQIEIDEGPQYHVGKIDVSGDLLQPKPELLKLVTLKTGEVFDNSKLRDDVLRLTDLYADEGFANVNVAPLTQKDKPTRTIDLNLAIEQGEKVYIEKIKIAGNTKTRDKVIRRELPIIEGDIYSASKIKESKRNIRNLGFFDEVNISTAQGSGRNQDILNVEVKERPTGTFSVGVGYSSVDQFLMQGSISQDNFLGYALKLNLSGAISAKSATYSLGVTDPHFLDTDWTLGGSLYKTEREFDNYSEYRNGGSVSAGYPVFDYTKFYLTYRYEEQEIIINRDENGDPVQGTSSFLIAQEGFETLSSITAELVRNSTDYHQDPSSGGISRLSLEYAGLGGTENFIKVTGEHRHFFPLFWDTVFSAHGALGYITRTGTEDLPIGERFFLGGISTLRGFRTREVGPKQGEDYIGGEKEAYFNLEFLFPIIKKLGLKGVLFYDTGNAWMDNQEYFSDMRQSVGAGIRWFSPLGPLRFEWGYNLSPRKDERQSVFEFSIGTPF